MQATREPRASTRCGSAPSIGFGLALLPLTVPAHHSFAPFDQTRLIDLSGVVVDFMLRSPHSILVIEAENNDGFAGLWEVEMGPNPIMRRQGFDADTFEPGDRIVVRGALRRDGVPGFLLGRGYFTADGAQIGRSNPLPVGEYEGPSGVDAADRFSGVWIVLRDPNINTFGDSPLPRTDPCAGRRARIDIRSQRQRRICAVEHQEKFDGALFTVRWWQDSGAGVHGRGSGVSHRTLFQPRAPVAPA